MYVQERSWRGDETPNFPSDYAIAYMHTLKLKKKNCSIVVIKKIVFKTVLFLEAVGRFCLFSDKDLPVIRSISALSTEKIIF